MKDQDRIYDIAIVGCGPAGLSAALNAKARNKDVVVLGGEFCSMKLHKSPEINNYLGIPEVGGEELRLKFLEHVEKLGVQVRHAVVNKIYPMPEDFQITVKTDLYRAKTVVLAMGHIETNYLPGEEDLLGRGVSYCATCDGMFYRDKKVAVVAYDNEAEQEANFLADICNEVIYLPQYKETNGLHPRITIVDKKPKGVLGENIVSSLLLENNQELDIDGVFIIRPITPVDQLVPGLETEGSTIKVNRKMATNIEGLFAAGDCTGRPWQLAKAVGEGQVAALSASSHIDVMRAKKTVHHHEKEEALTYS